MDNNLAVAQQETGVSQSQTFFKADLDSDNLPDLGQREVIKLNLMADYWTPVDVGESKDLYFSHIATSLVENRFSEAKEMQELKTAFFAERGADGEPIIIRNSSKRLVGTLEQLSPARGTAFSITYLGKEKNKTNGFSSDKWSIQAYK